MSRIGREPIKVPKEVEVSLNGNEIRVKGPKGSLTKVFDSNMTINHENDLIIVKRANDTKKNRSLHGLTRALISNMVEGVTKGFEKKLEINGVGYRVQKQGNDLILNLGYSHQVTVSPQEGIAFSLEGQNVIVVSGYDKQQVGQVAAQIREKRPPEPYKGKGIKYVGEHIVRKAGKAGKGSKG